MGMLDGKVAVITGGASGIGEGSVRLFVEQGARVVIADILDERGHALAEELSSAATFVHTDVAEESEVQAAVEAARSRFGALDCMFNNAGFAGVSGSILDLELEQYERTMAVLLRGVVLGIKHAGRAMKEQGRGSIVNTASVAALRTGMGPHVYSAAKAAVVHLTRSTAMELGEANVRVNCICPGAIATPIFGRAMGLSDAQAEATVNLLKPGFASAQPVPRAGLPEDIANAAAWLASDMSSFVNGQALVVDGGISNGRRWSDVQGGMSGLASAAGGNPARPIF